MKSAELSTGAYMIMPIPHWPRHWGQGKNDQAGRAPPHSAHGDPVKPPPSPPLSGCCNTLRKLANRCDRQEGVTSILRTRARKPSLFAFSRLPPVILFCSLSTSLCRSSETYLPLSSTVPLKPGSLAPGRCNWDHKLWARTTAPNHRARRLARRQRRRSPFSAASTGSLGSTRESKPVSERVIHGPASNTT
jgi:hypothetical protein